MCSRDGDQRSVALLRRLGAGDGGRAAVGRAGCHLSGSVVTQGGQYATVFPTSHGNRAWCHPDSTVGDQSCFCCVLGGRVEEGVTRLISLSVRAELVSVTNNLNNRTHGVTDTPPSVSVISSSPACGSLLFVKPFTSLMLFEQHSPER